MKTNLKLIALTLGVFFTFSCDKNDNNEYSVAEKQLRLDYPNYSLSNIKWTKEYSYDVARFSTQTKAATSNMLTAWYKVSGDKASRQMDIEDLGNTIPETILSAFNATVYSNTQLWTIDEVELENRYNGNGIEKVYEVELDSKTIVNLEAELYFDAKTGELLFSKEDMDEDSNDTEDKFVVNQELIDAVQRLYTGAQIVDAEIDNNQIEVEAIVTIDNVKKEIELLFDMNYNLIESEIEYDTTYGSLNNDFSSVTAWFTDPINSFPSPPAATKVEITQGNLVEDDLTPNFNYKYGVDIEYQIGQTEYEVMFYLDAKFMILKVVPEKEID